MPSPKAREYHLKTKYGITEEQYQQLFDKQEGKCYVCQRHQDEFPTRLAVDHNHKTLEIRGLLCRYCNHRLVGRHTNADLVARVAEYLRLTTGWFVPVKRRRKTPRRKVNGKTTTTRTKRSST